MPSPEIQARIGLAIVEYSSNGTFPDEESVAAAHIEDAVLPKALSLLNTAKSDLETEIREISRETIPDVASWMNNARAVQQDIERLRRLATEIVREAEDDDERLEHPEDRQIHLEFLENERLFNKRLGEALHFIYQVTDAVDTAERVAGEKNILAALRLLEEAWEMMDKIPVERTTRVIRLLDDRCFELRSFIHEQLTGVWKNLVHWDRGDKTCLALSATIEGEPTNMDEAIISWRAFRELDAIATQLWQDLDDYILKPRTDIQRRSLSSIQILKNTLSIGEIQADTSVKSLFEDLEEIIHFLHKNIPNELVKCLSVVMMPVLFTRIKEQWLDSAVPSSLDDMGEYQKSLRQVNDFAAKLELLNWPTADGFYDWVSNAHRIWLLKRKETSLDWTRNQLALGVGTPILAHHSEKKMIARDEGVGIAQAASVEVADWDAGWDNDEKEEPEPELQAGMNRASLEEERRASETNILQSGPSEVAGDDDDDAADAWGWGDDDTTEEPAPDLKPAEDKRNSAPGNKEPELREITLSEPYWTSSIPQPVFDTVNVMYNDGAELTKAENEQIPVASAGAGLFSIPTQVLAMYRAVSPYYYSRDANGNMYTYNDTIWLCDKLGEFVAAWEAREDLSPRARGLVKLNAEIEKLASFGKRAYTNELISQRTVINDFLGGTQNFLEGSRREEMTQSIETVIIHIRTTSEMWKKVLAYSAWASAVGSLVNSVAKKIISDVFDRDNLGADEANLIAELIVKVTALDDLFVPDIQPDKSSRSRNGTTSEDDTTMELGTAPLTGRFADKWWKMQYLGEVLQSNLANIKFLWFETGLSLEFTKEEVIDLILLSFENNPQVRALIKEIKESKVREMDELS